MAKSTWSKAKAGRSARKWNVRRKRGRPPVKRCRRLGLPRRGRAAAPMGHRPAHERSVVSPRRAVIIVDLAATRAIFPVPTLARVLRRPFQLLLGDIEAVPPQAGVIRERVPGERIVVAA